MFSRRTLLTSTAAALAMPRIVARVNAQSAFDWQQCKGQKIVVSLTKNPRADNLQHHEKEFEALTGIKVISEQMPEQQQRPKMVMELASGNPSFDVTHFSLHVSKRVIGVGNWLEDLRPYIANSSLTAPDYAWDDMSPGALRAVTQPDGRVDSLPLETDIWLVYYNREIFAKKGLAFPKTFDDMLATARTAQRSSGRPVWFRRARREKCQRSRLDQHASGPGAGNRDPRRRHLAHRHP